MSKVVFEISISLDGFITGPDQTPEQALGRGGERLHEWAFGEQGTELLSAVMAATGAIVVGRRTYDDSIRWWGADGPSGTARVPVFVPTHEPPAGRGCSATSTRRWAWSRSPSTPPTGRRT